MVDSTEWQWQWVSKEVKRDFLLDIWISLGKKLPICSYVLPSCELWCRCHLHWCIKGPQNLNHQSQTHVTLGVHTGGPQVRSPSRRTWVKGEAQWFSLVYILYPLLWAFWKDDKLVINPSYWFNTKYFLPLHMKKILKNWSKWYNLVHFYLLSDMLNIIIKSPLHIPMKVYKDYTYFFFFSF